MESTNFISLFLFLIQYVPETREHHFHMGEYIVGCSLSTVSPDILWFYMNESMNSGAGTGNK